MYFEAYHPCILGICGSPNILTQMRLKTIISHHATIHMFFLSWNYQTKEILAGTIQYYFEKVWELLRMCPALQNIVGGGGHHIATTRYEGGKYVIFCPTPFLMFNFNILLFPHMKMN